MLIKILHLGPPQNEDDLFDLLEPHLSNIPVLKAMQGFRNLLVHQYGTIAETRVLQYARENIMEFPRFIADVKQLIQKTAHSPLSES